MANKMIMVGENCPGFKLPTEIPCHGKQSALKNGEPFPGAKMMGLLICRSRYEVSAVIEQAMNRRMWPR